MIRTYKYIHKYVHIYIYIQTYVHEYVSTEIDTHVTYRSVIETLRKRQGSLGVHILLHRHLAVAVRL